MSIKAATPYLMLLGRAAEAIEFYEKALGAKVEALQRFGDVMENCVEAQKDHVMHAALRIGDALVFLSDGDPSAAPVPGGAVHVALELDDAARAREIFGALSAGGNVVQPLVDAPWGALFGAVDDRYGIGWMFNSTTT